MKKVLKFLAYPLLTALSTLVNFALIYFSSFAASSFLVPVSLIIYLFLGGIILNKINDKKTKNFSLLFTAIITLIGAIICAVQMHGGSDTAGWAGIIVFPFSCYISGLFINYYMQLIYLIAFVIGSVLPVLISYIASLIFGIKTKKLRYILIAVMVLACIGSAVKSAVNIKQIADNSIYKDGEFYHAYFDVNGNKYESYEDVLYYDKNGNVYYQTHNHSAEEYSDEGYSYISEMTDQNGNEYNIHDFYVYADGYIFMDKDNTVQMRNDLGADVITDWMYIDGNGNICSPLYGVYYSQNGEPYFGIGDEYKNK